MKKLSQLFVLLIIITLAACGSGDSSDSSGPINQALSGTWQVDLNLREYSCPLFSEDTGEPVPFSPDRSEAHVRVPMTIRILPDGTCQLGAFGEDDDFESGGLSVRKNSILALNKSVEEDYSFDEEITCTGSGNNIEISINTTGNFDGCRSTSKTKIKLKLGEDGKLTGSFSGGEKSSGSCSEADLNLSNCEGNGVISGQRSASDPSQAPVNPLDPPSGDQPPVIPEDPQPEDPVPPVDEPDQPEDQQPGVPPIHVEPREDADPLVIPPLVNGPLKLEFCKITSLNNTEVLTFNFNRSVVASDAFRFKLVSDNQLIPGSIVTPTRRQNSNVVYFKPSSPFDLEKIYEGTIKGLEDFSGQVLPESETVLIKNGLCSVL